VYTATDFEHVFEFQMVDICFSSSAENDTLGWSVRLVRQSDTEPDEPFRGTDDVISRSRSTDDASPTQVLYNITACVQTPEPMRIWVRDEEWEALDPLDELASQLRQKGHEEANVLAVGDELNDESPEFDIEALAKKLHQEARAACWGVTLNENAFVPGMPVENEKAQKLHVIAKRSGFEEGALRLFLSEYGLISTKEVTHSIYDRVRRRLQSTEMANLYNRKYGQSLE